MLLVSVLVVIIMIGVSAFLILRPFLLTDHPAARFDDASNETAVEKETVFSTLNEIEFDYKMNKLSEQDYKTLTARYKAMAARLIREGETASKTKNSGQAASVRNKLENDIEREIEEAVAALRKKSDRRK